MIVFIRKPKDPKIVIAYAVETRLRMIEPYLSHWPQALAIMTLPPNVPTSLANLLTLVDDIWYYAGDRSVDVSISYNSVFFIFNLSCQFSLCPCSNYKYKIIINHKVLL